MVPLSIPQEGETMNKREMLELAKKQPSGDGALKGGE
jgi:hypothetical protein